MVDQNAVNQVIWAMERLAEKVEAHTLAQNIYDHLPDAKKTKAAEATLARAKSQNLRAAEWIDHATLSDALPAARDPHDPDEWNRMTNWGRDVTSLRDVCNCVADALTADAKAKDLDVTMPRKRRVDDIKRKILSPEHPLHGSRTSAAADTYECKHSYDFTPLPGAMAGEGDLDMMIPEPDNAAVLLSEPIWKESNLCQRRGRLYRRITKFVQKGRQVSDKVSRKYTSAQAWYSDSPGAVWDQPPVTNLEDIRPIWIAAHVQEVFDPAGKPCIVHRGRDETYKRLMQGLSSSITKDLSDQLIKHCPGCNGRLEACQRSAEKAEPKREEKRETKRKARGEPEHEEMEMPAEKRQQRSISVERQQQYRWWMPAMNRQQRSSSVERQQQDRWWQRQEPQPLLPLIQ